MSRRRASSEQLMMLLEFLEQNKDLARADIRGGSLDSKIRYSKSWSKITEKLNSMSGLKSGVFKTTRKWQQTWRDWRSNVKKKLFTIQQNKYALGSETHVKLSRIDERILKLIGTNTLVHTLPGISETAAATNPLDTFSNQDSNENNSDMNTSTNSEKLQSDQDFITEDVEEIILEEVPENMDLSMTSNEVSSSPTISKQSWNQDRLSSLSMGEMQEKLLNIEEERIKIEKQKLQEKKHNNKIKFKIEQERLKIEKHRNTLLERILSAVEAIVDR